MFAYLWSLVCWYFRPLIKWFLRRTTRMCELQRICYGEPTGAPRTLAVEDSLQRSRNTKIKTLLIYLNDKADQCSITGDEEGRILEEAIRTVLGSTDKPTIERLHRRRINPLAVPDTNKFFDDKAEPGLGQDLQLTRDPRRRPYSEEVQVYELTGGVELVPLLTSRRHYSQPLTPRYLATDATRPGYTIESLRALGGGNPEYIAELAGQIRRKQERALEERRMEQESCRKHFDTWRRLWGRPGHGAPIDHAHRNNLYNILYRPAIY